MDELKLIPICMTLFVIVILGSVVFIEFIGVEEGVIETTILDIKYAGGGFLNPQKTILFTNSSSYVFLNIVAIDPNRPVRISYSFHPNGGDGGYYRLIDYEYFVED